MKITRRQLRKMLMNEVRTLMESEEGHPEPQLPDDFIERGIQGLERMYDSATKSSREREAFMNKFQDVLDAKTLDYTVEKPIALTGMTADEIGAIADITGFSSMSEAENIIAILKKEMAWLAAGLEAVEAYNGDIVVRIY